MVANKVIKSMDGNEAAAYCAYAFTDVAAIRLHHPTQWLNTLTFGHQTAKRIYSACLLK